MSMEPKTIAWFRAHIDQEGSIVNSVGYNCQIAGNGTGDYNITIGEGGADGNVCMTSLVPETAAAGGAGSARAGTVHHTSDTVKQIRFFDDAGAAADPAGFWVEFKRYPPLPTP